MVKIANALLEKTLSATIKTECNIREISQREQPYLTRKLNIVKIWGLGQNPFEAFRSLHFV